MMYFAKKYLKCRFLYRSKRNVEDITNIAIISYKIIAKMFAYTPYCKLLGYKKT